MRLYKNVFILAVVLAVLVGGYYLIDVFKNDEIEEENNDDTESIEKLIDIERENIVEMYFKNDKGELDIVKTVKTVTDEEGNESTEDVWNIAGDDSIKLNNSTARNIQVNIASIDPEAEIGVKTKEELKEYGLDEPAIAGFKLEDGTQYEIHIGNLSYTKDVYYIKLKDDDTVYTYDEYYGEKLLSGLMDFKAKDLMALTAEEITQFSLERENEDGFSCYEVDDSTWKLTYPINIDTSSGDMETLLQSFVSITMDEYIELDAKELSQYGLDNPKYKITIGTGTDSFTLKLGKTVPGTSYFYAMKEGSNDVFTVADTYLDFIDKPVFSIVNAFLALPYINDVEKVTAKFAGKTVTSIHEVDEEDSDNDKFYVDGKDASMLDEDDGMVYRDYYIALLSTTKSKLEIEADPVLKDPVCTIKYYLKDSDDIIQLDFVTKDEYYCYAFKNEEYTKILVETDKIDAIDEAYNLMMDYINNAETGSEE